MGIEPTSEAWEASILPLYDARPEAIVPANRAAGKRLHTTLLAGGAFARFVVVGWGIGQAAGCGQVADIYDDGPDFVVAQNSVCSRHSAGPQSVFDHPEKLAVAVGLHGLGRQRGKRWRHGIRKRHSCALAVESVADVAVVRKSLFSAENVLRGCGHRISRPFVLDKKMVFRGVYHQCLELACGFCCGAAHKQK